MEIAVSPTQVWHYPLGAPFLECRSRLVLSATDPTFIPARGDGVYDGMYVEAFGARWLAGIAFKEHRICQETLVLTTADDRRFQTLYKLIKAELGRAYRRGLFRATRYIWEFPTSRLILTVKKAGPLTGIYLILTANQ